MILLAGWIWEGTSLEVKPLPPAGKNGQVFKELDTGDTYHLRDGVWEYANIGLAFVKATKSGRATTDASGLYTVTFTTPLINDQYSIALSVREQGVGGGVIAYFNNRSATGFTIQTRRATSGMPAPDIDVSWLATRDFNP
jgi:hypothetical protein